jgi:hypothetical protein
MQNVLWDEEKEEISGVFDMEWAHAAGPADEWFYSFGNEEGAYLGEPDQIGLEGLYLSVYLTLELDSGRTLRRRSVSSTTGCVPNQRFPYPSTRFRTETGTTSRS